MAAPITNIRPDRALKRVAYRLLDATALLGLLVVFVAWLSPAEMVLAPTIGGLAVAAFFVCGEMTTLYRSWRGARAERETYCVLGTWLATAAIVLTAGYLAGWLTLLPRRLVLGWLLATAATLIVYRLCVRQALCSFRRKGWNVRSCGIVGVNPLALQLGENLLASPDLGLRLEGFFDDRAPDRNTDIPAVLGTQVGTLDELVERARTGDIETVYVTFPMRAEDRIRRDILERLSDTTASVYIVPDIFVFELLHARWTDVGGLPAVSVFENPLYGIDGLAKRLVDLAAASLALLLTAIPMCIVAIGIKLTSRGPVFFRQQRYGLDGRSVRVWKFRSMTVCEDGDHVQQAQKGDQRVTRLGEFLRKSSLDELPQLFNVLAGAMSLVGPRPHANAHNEHYRKVIPGYMLRHKVKPGITGLAQVNGFRGETDTLEKMAQRVHFDHAYIREWSLWMDIKILFQTLFIVWSQKNAY